MNRTLAMLVAALVVTTLVSAGTAVYALAGHVPGEVQSITGCITATGKLAKVKLGDTPKGESCGAQTEVHLSGGDITAVLPGYGIDSSSGATNGAASVAVDPTVIQNRVTKPCGPDAAISQINEDGSVDCDQDDGFRNLVVVANGVGLDSSDRKSVSVDCPAGTALIGGGANVAGEAFLKSSSPTPFPNPVGWRAAAAEQPAHEDIWGLSVYAVCADID